MVSATTAAIIAAVCAAGGALLGTVCAGMWTHRIEKFKRHREEMDISQRYRDPLLRAAERLQTRIRGLCQQPLQKVDVDTTNVNDPHSYDYSFTLFLFGQFFTWSLALENDVPTKHRKLSDGDLQVLNVLYKIHRIMDDPDTDETFRVYIGTQTAIGEVMTIENKGSSACIGYSEFLGKWISNPVATTGTPDSASQKNNPVAFQTWFHQIESGLESLRSIPEDFPPCITVGAAVPFLTGDQKAFPFRKLHRLIQFQHLLISLILVLDPDQRRGPQHVRDCIQAWDEGINEDEFKCQCERCPWYSPLNGSRGGTTLTGRSLFHHSGSPSLINRLTSRLHHSLRTVLSTPAVLPTIASPIPTRVSPISLANTTALGPPILYGPAPVGPTPTSFAAPPNPSPIMYNPGPVVVHVPSSVSSNDRPYGHSHHTRSRRRAHRHSRHHDRSRSPERSHRHSHRRYYSPERFHQRSSSSSSSRDRPSRYDHEPVPIFGYSVPRKGRPTVKFSRRRSPSRVKAARSFSPPTKRRMSSRKKKGWAVQSKTEDEEWDEYGGERWVKMRREEDGENEYEDEEEEESESEEGSEDEEQARRALSTPMKRKGRTSRQRMKKGGKRSVKVGRGKGRASTR